MSAVAIYSWWMAVYSLFHLQWHFPKFEAKPEANVYRSLFTETWQKRPTIFSCELCKEFWKSSLTVGQAVNIFCGYLLHVIYLRISAVAIYSSSILFMYEHLLQLSTPSIWQLSILNHGWPANSLVLLNFSIHSNLIQLYILKWSVYVIEQLPFCMQLYTAAIYTSIYIVIWYSYIIQKWSVYVMEQLSIFFATLRSSSLYIHLYSNYLYCNFTQQPSTHPSI